MKKSQYTAEDLKGLSCTEILYIESTTIMGGGVVEDLGYSLGFAVGYFFAAGPRILGQAASIAKGFR